tara:strand:- start:491 stop:736 length:246 start_codon:yes stop_codon:yes gene_type:complete
MSAVAVSVPSSLIEAFAEGLQGVLARPVVGEHRPCKMDERHAADCGSIHADPLDGGLVSNFEPALLLLHEAMAARWSAHEA